MNVEQGLASLIAVAEIVYQTYVHYLRTKTMVQMVVVAPGVFLHHSVVLDSLSSAQMVRQ